MRPRNNLQYKMFSSPVRKNKPNRDTLSNSQTGKYYRNNNNINNNAGSWKGFAEEMLHGEKQKLL